MPGCLAEIACLRDAISNIDSGVNVHEAIRLSFGLKVNWCEIWSEPEKDDNSTRVPRSVKSSFDVRITSLPVRLNRDCSCPIGRPK